MNENTKHEVFMRRCFDLAKLGAGHVSPNPMVGAVIVHKDKIIGEGWHEAYGQAHAEVNAVNSVKEENRKYLSASTIYVSLEPCCIFGKTPPCSDLILQNKIPEVVVSCLDATPGVAGNSVKLLREAGLSVTTGILEKEGLELAKVRNTFAGTNRPYIILKYAQSQDGFIGQQEKQIWLTNPYSKRLAHKWRSETDAILVGTNTVQTDDPELTNRYWWGGSPLRIFFDKSLKISQDKKVYQDEQPTLILTEKDINSYGFARTKLLNFDFSENVPEQLCTILGEWKISSLLVEGGAFTLQKFIDSELWDEARIFSTDKILGKGVKAPEITGEIFRRERLDKDILTILKNKPV